MRRHRRNRATWFPVLGFEGSIGNPLTTVDARQLTVNADGTTNVTVVPIIPDIDTNVDESQTGGGGIVRSLRDYVEGQSCIIERVVGNIQIAGPRTGNTSTTAAFAVAAAIAVVPTVDDGTGNPAVSTADLDPLNANNIAQPWLWRRVWNLGFSTGTAAVGSNADLPGNNLFGSLAEGSKIDTKGTKRAIRREERIFLIYSTLALFPDGTNQPIINGVFAMTDLRVIGRMVRARNRSNFK